MEKLKTLTNGIIKENPVLILVLGTCPTLATSTSVQNAIGMGAAATFVLLGSNIVISLLKKVIPDKVRIPCYIVVIAGFVTIVQLLLQAFLPDLYNALGIFLPLIVVNCIILGRAEMFANKNGVGDSALDAIGMGIGFTLTLFCMATIRELLGYGTWFGIPVTKNLFEPISIMKDAPGGFITFGCLIAVANWLNSRKKPKKAAEQPKDFGCQNCPAAAACGGAEKGGCTK